MDKRVKTIVSIAAITAIGAILPTLAALIVHGLPANSFAVSNYIFSVGILVAVAGGVWSILPFFIYKSKLRRAKRGEEVEVNQREGLLWEYILMSAGVFIIVISYIVAIL